VTQVEQIRRRRIPVDVGEQRRATDGPRHR
jgi:hypothetical protein